MVSILVPIYNVAPFIEKCARSLFGQTYNDIEYIFVDDASPDNSIEILTNVMKDYPHLKDNIKIIPHNINKGIAGTRNTAVKAAEGDYILHVDSDDWLEPDAVETLVKTALDFNADIVYSDFFEERKSSTRILENPEIDNASEYCKSLLRRKSLTHIIGKLIRKKIVLDNNLWTVEGINQGEDYLITPKLAYYSKKVVKAKKPIYHYNRLNLESYTANVTNAGIDMVIRVQSLLVDFFSNIPDSEKYKDTLKESCIYNKLTCFYSGPLSSYKRISNLYDSIKWKNIKLKKRQKLILYLSDFKLFNLLYALLRIIQKISK